MRRIALLAVVVVVLFNAEQSAASIAFYTFEGTITGMSDPGGLAAAAGLSVGGAVSYTFAVDFNADGFTVHDPGGISVKTDDSLNDYFYADFISGTLLQESAVFFDNPFSNIVEQNFGRNKVDNGNVLLGTLVGNSHLETTKVDNTELRVSDWVIGTSVQGYDQTYTTEGEKSFVNSALSVTSISDTPPIPEPTTFIVWSLLGLTAVGISYRRTHGQRRSQDA